MRSLDVGAGECAHPLAHVRRDSCVVCVRSINTVDGWTDRRKGLQMNEAETIALIKREMPNVYQSIQAKAKEIGNDAFALVRQGLRGKPGCFYAFERGHVVGTPFNEPEINAEIAMYMVTFGCAHVCIWAAKREEANGAH